MVNRKLIRAKNKFSPIATFAPNSACPNNAQVLSFYNNLTSTDRNLQQEVINLH